MPLAGSVTLVGLALLYRLPLKVWDSMSWFDVADAYVKKVVSKAFGSSRFTEYIALSLPLDIL